jgi:phage shock protein E
MTQVPRILIVQEEKGATRMKRLLLLTLTILCVVPVISAQGKAGIPNPSIDMEGYLRVSAEAAAHRESRRLTEEDFIRMSQEPGTVILDARSREKYNELHIKGAINLSFPDITVASLESTLPDKNTRILIYCNNNFVGAQAAFPTKIAVASLNLSTYIALYSYGYRNVYELGPLLDIKTSKLDLISSTTPRWQRDILIRSFFHPAGKTRGEGWRRGVGMSLVSQETRTGICAANVLQARQCKTELRSASNFRFDRD